MPQECGVWLCLYIICIFYVETDDILIEDLLMLPNEAQGIPLFFTYCYFLSIGVDFCPLLFK